MAVNKDDYAVIIGINTYTLLFPLKAAHADAVAFQEWLISEDGGGVPTENIGVFLGNPKPEWDPSKAKPIQRHIDHFFRQIGIESNERIGRRLYFYFAGHGFGPEFDNIGMLMVDASETNLNENMGLWEYRQFFRNHHIFDEVVYILDCCRDPAPLSRGLQLRGPGFTLPDNKNNVNDFVIMAAAYGKKAYAVSSKDQGQRRGLLTRAFLDGLTNAHDGKGRITSSTLREYLLERVPKLVDELKGVDKKLKDQVPEIPAIPHPEMVFATIPVDSSPKLNVQVIAGPGNKGNLVLYDGGARKLDEFVAKDATADQPWELALDRNSLVYVLELSSNNKQIPILPSTVTQEPHVVVFD